MKISGTSKTKESKYNSTVGLFIGIGMLLWALLVFDFSEMPFFAKAFMVVWIGGICAQLYQSYRNSIFSSKSLHYEVTDHDLNIEGVNKFSSPPSHLNSQSAQKGYAQRIRELEQLYRDGLITTEEYDAKRKDILDEDWGK